MTLTKADIVDKIQEDLQLPKKECVNIVENLLEIMKQTMSSGEDVLVSGFGKFCVKEKKQRRGRNPSTGDDMMLDPRRVVTFRCSGKLRGKLNS
ncbi:Integration host factor, subunit alpha [Desulfonema limicola]|uniref:Integration host factor subunit alpha n=1 Tax=Desulfonema limicola TaxID=45656 RepID=A0A975B3T9_9BACT|nr:integration host factor subunit alpha [Desulfonema limicola]QTA78263.1 Integration host factor, subunit alpha [Desulfonema limicola]